MRKIEFVAGEFFRSFWKGLFKDVLLMVMFSISFVMAVIMCSYYFDMGERYADMTQQVGNSTWCKLELMMEGGDEISGSLTSPAGCQNIMDYYEALVASEECPIISINTQQSLFIREKEVKGFFGDRDCTGFLAEWQKEPIMGKFTDTETCSMMNMQSAQVDLGAYRFFGLKTQEGEGFTEQNMVVRQASDPIPIVLGSGYKGVMQVGDMLEANYWNYIYPCRVVGILEEGASLPENGQLDVGDCQLDYRILFPFGIRLEGEFNSQEVLERYAFLDYLSLDNGIAQVKDGKVNEQVASFREMGEAYSLPSPHLIGASLGVELLRKESASNVRILLILTIALLCFSFYGLFITFYDKVRSNSRIYGIYLMNGCPVSLILIPCLLEVMVILLPSLFVSGYVFGFGNIELAYRMDVVARAACGLVGLAFLVGTGFLLYFMRGVDTEHLIRQRE